MSLIDSGLAFDLNDSRLGDIAHGRPAVIGKPEGAVDGFDRLRDELDPGTDEAVGNWLAQ
ncbi:MAG: hypothetical protein V7700_08085 [Halioglobus sp.]